MSFLMYLNDEERKRLNNFPVGQGLFFAGSNHVHIQVIASETEESLITTNPAAATNETNNRPQTPLNSNS